MQFPPLQAVGVLVPEILRHTFSANPLAPQQIKEVEEKYFSMEGAPLLLSSQYTEKLAVFNSALVRNQHLNSSNVSVSPLPVPLPALIVPPSGKEITKSEKERV